jgi:uncharacterized repeat protein (TIGR04138 family)
MKKVVFQEAVEQIAKRDSRYPEHAYFFLREALDFSLKLLNKPAQGAGRHVSGQELLEGIRQYALQEYGPMAQTVLSQWGIKRCEDFGELVFNLVEAGVLGKTESDRKEDFTGGYEFETAFRKPYRPRTIETTSRLPRPASERANN